MLTQKTVHATFLFMNEICIIFIAKTKMNLHIDEPKTEETN